MVTSASSLKKQSLSSILQSRQQPVSSSSWSTASLLSSNQVVRPTDIHSCHSSTDYYKYSFLPRTMHRCRLELCHSHYEPSRRLIHSVQVCSTSLSPGHLTEQNDNTPAVTSYAHCWIFHRSTEENEVGSRRSKFKVTRGRRVIGGPGGDIILESSRFSSFLVSSANN